jgi:hypothetical protein
MALEQHPSAKENQELHRRWRDARADWEIEARSDIDFYHGNHFTNAESEELQSRNQADVKAKKRYYSQTSCIYSYSKRRL